MSGLMIGVYAICKNEEKNINDWFASCSDADVICVTDTGSVDNSIKALQHLDTRALTINRSYVMPWRFDDAMNAALNALPPAVDVAIRLDLDERLQPGWRAGIERAWTEVTTKLMYPYVWNWQDDGTPGFMFLSDRIHARSGYRWSGATHEGLKCRIEEVITTTDLVRIHQYPDRTKPRPNDLPLLLEAVRDTPHDARLWAYLGREYMWRRMNAECIETCMHFLSLPNSMRSERMAAFTHMAQCTADVTHALAWLGCAIEEAPEYREPWIYLMTLHYNRQEWEACYAAARRALEITVRQPNYVVLPQSWGSYPHDICSIAAFQLGLVDVAIEQVKLALALSPSDTRLQGNFELFSKARAA